MIKMTERLANALVKEYAECKADAMRFEEIDAKCGSPYGNKAAQHRAAMERRRMGQIRVLLQEHGYIEKLRPHIAITQGTLNKTMQGD